jgi:hypothetical protein
VIVGLFASQLASVPHAHAGISAEEQQKHDATPHFHCTWLSHAHHEHGHSHDGHSHHHDRPAEPAERTTLPDGLNGVGHDATAVYCPGRVLAASVVQQDSLLSLLSDLGTLALSQPPAELRPCGGMFGRRRPPDEAVDGSNIYLKLRNLRI